MAKSGQLPETALNKISELYDRWGEALYHYALTLTKFDKDAEEVVQNLFLIVARKWRRISRVKDVKNYLYRATRNQALNFISRQRFAQKARKEIEKNSLVHPEKNDPRRKAEAERLNQLLAELPREQREIIVLKIYQGFTFSEISRILKIPANTCASRYRYGLAKLREKLL